MSLSRLPIVLAVAIAALVVPAAASASFQARIIDPTNINLTGTDDAEAIVIGSDAMGRLTHDQTSPGFASALDFDTFAPGTQVVTGSPIVGVDGEGGNDSIRLTAPGARLRADGGEGDDVITGSQHHDVIQGGPGDDYARGLGASDAIYLGTGDDSYQWTGRTDGSDLVVGGDGADDASAWGSQLADEFNISPLQGGFRAALVGAGSLHIEAVESLHIPLFSGDDAVSTELLPEGLRLDVDGGAGDDMLAGGPGPDDLLGGDGRDSVSGYGGDDVLSGESVGGDVGNDRMTVNASGAGSPIAEGDEGYDVTNVITTSGDDSLSVSRQPGSLVRIQGTANGQPYSAHVLSEAVVLQTGAGNDTATVQPGTGTVAAVSMSGGIGDDVLRGSDGIEHLFGSAGQDVLDGGLGPDSLMGSSGDDVIRARDRAADTIECESGNDVLVADLGEAGSACEQVDQAAPAAAIPLARVAPTDKLRLGGLDVVKVPVACSAGARGGCQGTVTLVSAHPLANGFTTPLRLGSQPIALAPGATTEVSVKVADPEDLARAFGTRQLTVHAQVLTDLAEHSTLMPLEIQR